MPTPATVPPEDVPDGTFGDSRNRGPRKPAFVYLPRPDPNAARHVAELLAAYAGYRVGRPAHPAN